MSNPISLSPCPSCLQGKLAKIPLASVEHHATSPLEIVHADIWGPYQVHLDFPFKK